MHLSLLEIDLQRDFVSISLYDFFITVLLHEGALPLPVRAKQLQLLTTTYFG